MTDSQVWSHILAACKWLLSEIPQPAPPAPAVPNPTVMTPLANTILAYSQGHSFFADGPAYTVIAKGVIVHELDAGMALEVANEVQVASATLKYPLTFLLACLGVESVLDPDCQNGNLGPEGSNTDGPDNLGGYDMGIAQLKLMDLAESEKISVAQAETDAFDISFAIPYHISLMLGHLAWAEGVIAKNTSSAPDSRWAQPNGAYLLATGAYNFGETGMLDYYNQGVFPGHCVSVLNDEKYFAEKIGTSSIFGDISAS